MRGCGQLRGLLGSQPGEDDSKGDSVKAERTAKRALKAPIAVLCLS